MSLTMLERFRAVTNCTNIARRTINAGAVVAVVFLGCQRRAELASVRGKVTLDGQPLPEAFIVFSPTTKGTTSYGKTEIIIEDSNLRFSNVEDGTSNTFLAGETVYFGVGTDDPNTVNNFYWDATWYGHFKKDTGGRADAPECMMRTGQYRINPPKVAAALVQRNTFSSRHPSGANFVMADGSTRFVSTTVDHTESVFNGQILPPNAGTFQRLCARNDGLTIGYFLLMKRFLLLLALLLCSPLAAQDQAKPNILFLFADD